MSEEATLDEFVDDADGVEGGDVEPTSEDWRDVNLIDLCEMGGGSTPSKSNPEYWNRGEILWTTPKDFDGPRLKDTQDKITRKGAEESTSRIYPKGTTLLVVRSGVLRHTLPVSIVEKPTTVNQDLKALEPNREQVNPEYFFQAISGLSEDIRGSCKKTGTTVESIQTNVLKQYPVPVPPLPEQRKIATVLHTVDRAIEKTEDVIRSLQRILRGTRRDVMKNGIRTHQMSGSDSRFGDVPEVWDVERLDSVTDVTGGSTPSTDEPRYWSGEIPWATPTDLTGSDEVTINTTESYITEEGLNSTSTNLLPRQSVLMTSRATIGECAINTVEMATNQGFQSLVPHDGVDVWYLYYRMEEEANYLNSLGSGSTFSEVSNTTVQRVKIPIPPVDEQKEIANVLRSIDETIIKEKEYKSQLQRFKRGLMQDLLSGTVRTTDTNIEVPDEIAQYG